MSDFTLEEKDNIISQIEGIIGTRPLFYLKFCECKEYASDILNGDLFGNTATYFRECEKLTNERGQGDAFETINIIRLQDIVMRNKETGDVFLRAPTGEIKVKFGADEKIPIISFVGIPLRDMKFIDADDSHVAFAFPFSQDEYETMQERFGSYCVVMNAREIEQRIELYCKLIGAEYVFEKIKYCPQNTKERIEAFNIGSKDRFLYSVSCTIGITNRTAQRLRGSAGTRGTQGSSSMNSKKAAKEASASSRGSLPVRPPVRPPRSCPRASS